MDDWLLALMVAHQISKVSAPKYALGLKIREPLCQKRTFLYIGHSKSAPEPLKSVPKCTKNVSLVCQNRGPIFYESNFSFDSFQLQIGARMLQFGARWYFSWTLEFFPFFAFSSRNYNDFHIKIHKND